MIRAIVSSCGFVETQQLGCILWVATEEMNDPMEALKLLKDDLLRSYLYSQPKGLKTYYSPGIFAEWICVMSSSTNDDSFLIPNDDEAHFWPYESFSCLFDYLIKEILFVNENFEKVMSSLVTKEEAKAMFDEVCFDDTAMPQKAIQVIANPNDVLTVELDYERVLCDA